MESVKYVGLDDCGRQVVVTRVLTDDKSQAYEMVALLDGETNTMQVIRARHVTDALTIEACKMEMAAAELYSGITVTGRIRGSGKSQALLQMYGSALSGSSSGSVGIRSDSITVFDEVSKPRVKMGLLHKNKKDQGHVNRKPQPNRGPVGKRGWK